MSIDAIDTLEFREETGKRAVYEAYEETPEYTEHVEPPAQGGKRYVRCGGCGRELLTCLGGRDRLLHAEGCPNARKEETDR